MNLETKTSKRYHACLVSAYNLKWVVPWSLKCVQIFKFLFRLNAHINGEEFGATERHALLGWDSMNSIHSYWVELFLSSGLMKENPWKGERSFSEFFFHWMILWFSIAEGSHMNQFNLPISASEFYLFWIFFLCFSLIWNEILVLMYWNAGKWMKIRDIYFNNSNRVQSFIYEHSLEKKLNLHPFGIIASIHKDALDALSVCFWLNYMNENDWTHFWDRQFSFQRENVSISWLILFLRVWLNEPFHLDIQNMREKSYGKPFLRLISISFNIQLVFGLNHTFLILGDIHSSAWYRISAFEVVMKS